jgi:hypothetical protein
MPPVLPTERIAHLSCGRRLLRCGISVRPMSQLGHSRPGRARIRSSYVCYAPKCGSQNQGLGICLGGLMMPPPRSMHRRSRTAHLAISPEFRRGRLAAACCFPAVRWPLVSPGALALQAPSPATRRARAALWLPPYGCPSPGSGIQSSSGAAGCDEGGEGHPRMPIGRQAHQRPR